MFLFVEKLVFYILIEIYGICSNRIGKIDVFFFRGKEIYVKFSFRVRAGVGVLGRF